MWDKWYVCFFFCFCGKISIFSNWNQNYKLVEFYINIFVFFIFLTFTSNLLIFFSFLTSSQIFSSLIYFINFFSHSRKILLSSIIYFDFSSFFTLRTFLIFEYYFSFNNFINLVLMHIDTGWRKLLILYYIKSSYNSKKKFDEFLKNLFSNKYIYSNLCDVTKLLNCIRNSFGKNYSLSKN